MAPLLIFNLGFIALLLPFGIDDGTGNRAWLKFPGIPFQIGPAEVVKITFVLLLAKQIEWLWQEKEDVKSFSSAFAVAAHTLGLCGLYFVVSHDMGNGLVFVFIFCAWPLWRALPCGGFCCSSPESAGSSPPCCCWTWCRRT